MGLKEWFTGAPPEPERERALTLSGYLQLVQSYGQQYGSGWAGSLAQGPQQEASGYDEFAKRLYGSNAVVFAVMTARARVFSEARFIFRQRRSGGSGDLFGTSALDILDTPWRSGTTGDLLTRALQDVDLAGNFYAVVDRGQIRRLPPQHVVLVIGSNTDEEHPKDAWDAEVIGYIHRPPSGVVTTFLPEFVAHWSPIPDPTMRFLGQSWLQPAMHEILADTAAMRHKGKFFENGATPSTVVKLDPTIRAAEFDTWVKLFKDGHEGVNNAYKTLYLSGGADVSVIGANLEQIDFANVIAHGETRIAAAAGIPSIVVGFQSGLEASTYSNFAQARRVFADGALRPLWRSLAASLATLVDVPQASELWYDDRDISFLQEDQQDAANILSTNTTNITGLVNAGFDPASAVAAVKSGDLDRLVHSGMMSVQLHPPGSQQQPSEKVVVVQKGAEPKQIPASTGNGRAISDQNLREMLQAFATPARD